MQFYEPKFYAVGGFGFGQFRTSLDLAPGDLETLAYAEADLQKIVKWCLSLTSFSNFRITRALHSSTRYAFDANGELRKNVHYISMDIEVDFMGMSEYATPFKERWWNGATV